MTSAPRNLTLTEIQSINEDSLVGSRELQRDIDYSIWESRSIWKIRIWIGGFAADFDPDNYSESHRIPAFRISAKKYLYFFSPMDIGVYVRNEDKIESGIVRPNVTSANWEKVFEELKLEDGSIRTIDDLNAALARKDPRVMKAFGTIPILFIYPLARVPVLGKTIEGYDARRGTWRIANNCHREWTLSDISTTIKVLTN